MLRICLSVLLVLGSTCCATCFGAELIVAAASDLAPLEKPLAEAFQKRVGGGATVKFTFGSSGSLMNQIEHGAPYDVFLAAQERYVRTLVTNHKISPGSVRVYAIGRVALWSKSGSVKSLDDLKKPEVQRIAVANPETAPYGAAARQALNSAGLWPVIKDKVVFAENIRQTLQFAESGNAEAALVSWSLVHDKGGILLPATLHAPIRQTGGIVSGSKQAELALKFLDFLSSAEGQKLLEQGGLFKP